jgi:transcriptional regulator with XRE-family HTH domain
MVFIDRLLSLCEQNNTDVSTVLRELKLSTSKGTAWRGGSIPNGEILVKLANYFHVSVDYLLGITDIPTPADKIVPTQIDLSGLDGDLVENLVQLTPGEQGKAGAYIQALLDKRST